MKHVFQLASKRTKWRHHAYFKQSNTNATLAKTAIEQYEPPCGQTIQDYVRYFSHERVVDTFVEDPLTLIVLTQLVCVIMKSCNGLCLNFLQANPAIVIWYNKITHKTLFPPFFLKRDEIDTKIIIYVAVLSLTVYNSTDKRNMWQMLNIWYNKDDR